MLKHSVLINFFDYKKYLLLFSIIFFSCEAPRNNPSDPLSPVSANGVIQGVVQTLSVPRNPVEGVMVYWLAENKYTVTSSDGSFILNGIKNSDGYLIFRKEGFKEDSLFIQWNNQTGFNADVELNSIPLLESVKLNSVVINQASGKTSQLVLQANIIDRENDIVSVWVWNDTLNFSKNLGYNAVSKTFETTLSSNEMNVNDIEETAGMKFNLTAADTFGGEYQLGSAIVSRIISNGAAILSPSNSAIVDSLPVLVWQNFSASFSFYYSVEVYTNDVNAVLVYSKENIPSAVNSIQVDIPLLPAEYFWVVWVTDNLMNKVRSARSLFIIE